MKVSYYHYPVYNDCNISNTNFTGLNKTISSSYGVFSKNTQANLENLHSNLNSIQKLFLKFAHYPAKAIAIKDGYPKLLQKNRNSGISFQLPDNLGVMTIRQLRANPNLLRFIVEKDGKATHILTDGFNKSVANINENNPQFLPRKFRYMQHNEIKELNIEKLIEYTSKEIDDYNKYLDQFRIPEKLQEVQVPKKGKAKKTQLTEQDALNIVKPELKTDDIKKVMNLFKLKPQDLSENLKPIIGSNNNILGFNLQTQDGGTLKVTKKLNAKYGGNMAYLSFEKLFPDGERSYMSIDLLTYKFLKMREFGKPLIKSHAVMEYSPEEIEKHNMVEKFYSYFDEIMKDVKVQEHKIEPQKQETEIVNNTEKEVVKPHVQPEKSEHIQEVKISDEHFEQIKQNTILKAKNDARILSDLYFKTFMEEFNKNISQKIQDFKTNIDKLFTK